MAVITKGYKVGRGVAFYDIEEYTGSIANQKVLTRVPKDDVVKSIENGVITNAKVQWWQGKPIVRVQNNIELVKIIVTDGLSKEEQTAKRGQTRVTTKSCPASCTGSDKPEIKAKVVGKLSKKRSDETVYEAVIRKEIDEHKKAVSTVKYDGMETLEDLVDHMISDFRLRDTDKYKSMLAKKIKLSQKLSGIAQSNLIGIQESIAVYLMNMSYMETRDTYTKYLRA